MDKPFVCGECTNYDTELIYHCKDNTHFSEGKNHSIGSCDCFHQTETSVRERLVK